MCKIASEKKKQINILSGKKSTNVRRGKKKTRNIEQNINLF